MEECKTCKFYKSHGTASDGHCLRNAPSPVVHSINVNEMSLNWQNEFSYKILLVKWPTVSEDNWCGEYQLDKPNSISQDVQE